MKKFQLSNLIWYRAFEHRRTIDGEESICLVIIQEEANEVVCSCSLRMVPEAEHALVTNLFTSEKHRKKGLAGWLLKWAGELALEYGMERLTLTVQAPNFETVGPFYRNSGFEVVYRFQDGESIFSKDIPKPDLCRK